MAKINLRDYLASVSVKATNTNLDKVTILDSSDGNKIKTILKEDLVDINEIVAQLQDDFVRFGNGVVSSSSQINITQTQNYTASIEYTDSNVKDKLNSENVLSSSAQIDVTQTTNYSSINQYSDSDNTSHLNSLGVVSGSINEYTDSNVKDKLNTENVISGSDQVTGIGNSQITNSSITINGTEVSLGGSVSTPNDNTQLSTDAVQDIVGGMVSDNTESGISVTYDDSENSLNFSVTSQTDNNFTNTLKSKLDNIEGTADVTDNGNVHPILDAKEVLSGSISSSNITDVDAFSQSGTYSGLRAQSTTAADVGLGNVTNESKATMFTSPAFTTNPTAPTQTGTDDSTKLATTEFVQARISNIIGNAGSTLDTLGELSASLAEDSSSLSILTTTVGTKLAKSSNLSDLTDVSIARANLGVLSGSSEIDVTLTTNYSSINQYTDSDNTSHLNSLGVVSGSSQIDHDQTTNFSADEHFTQANITTVGTVTTGNVNAILPTGTVSGSSQIDVTQTTNYGSINQYTDSDNLSYLNSLLVVSKSAGGDLDVDGSITASRLRLADGLENLLISPTISTQAGEDLTVNGSYNILFGALAGMDIVSGDHNIGIGYATVRSISDETSDHNIGIGFNALRQIDSGSDNIAIGREAVSSQTGTRQGVIGIGQGANKATTSNYTIAIGHQAGLSTGQNFTGIGYRVGYGLNSTATQNTALGYQSLGGYLTTIYEGSGDFNTAVGSYALGKVVDGSWNTVMGRSSGLDITSGKDNTLLGETAGIGISTGDANVVVGRAAAFGFHGSRLVSGSGNTLLGFQSDVQNSDDYNSIVIGSGSLGNGSNTVVIGNDDITSTELKGDVVMSGSLSVHDNVTINEYTLEIESTTSSAAKTTGALVVGGGIGVGGAITADFVQVIRSNPKMMVTCNDTTITAGQTVGSYEFRHQDNDGGFNGSVFSIDLVAKDDFTGFGSTPAEFQFNTGINVDGDISGSALYLDSRNDGASGAQIDLFQFSSSPNTGDAHGVINFGGYWNFNEDFDIASSIKSIWSENMSDKKGELQFWVRDNTTFESNVSIKGDGIVFGGNTVTGNKTSVTLNNYEEGTWTPTITNANGTLVVAGYDGTGSPAGQYTRVGRMVTLFLQFEITDLDGASSGALVIQGMPFNCTLAGGVGGQGVIPTTGKTLNIARYSDTVLHSYQADGSFAGTGAHPTSFVIHYNV